MTENKQMNILPALLIMLLLLGWSGCSGNNDAAPKARHGVMDLSALDMARFGPVRLDGEWEFYWNQLLTPEDFHGPRVPAGAAFISLPGAWNGFNRRGVKPGREGFATFRLRILPGSGKRELALHLEGVHSAYRLWADGKLLVESGVVGRDVSEEVAGQAIRQHRLNVAGRPIELVLQISNYHYREAGLVSSIELGPEDELEAKQLKEWALALLCAGGMLVMGVYHIALFYFRRRNSAPLYFGVYCLLWMGFTLTSDAGDWVVRIFFDQYPAWLLNRIDLICFVLSIPVGYGFFRILYPGEFALRLQRALWAASSLFAAMGIALSTMAFTTAIPAYYILSILMILYCVAMLFKAMRRKREGASFLLLGCSVLGFAGVNDMLNDLQLIRSVYLIHFGMFVFTLFQAVALSMRFSRAFTSVEQLSNELTDKNAVLEQEIVERTRLEREVVNISEEERRRISHELHDGLCQKLTGARLHFSVLERKLARGPGPAPEMTRLSSLLEDSVNQAYDLSRGLWPVEADPEGTSLLLEELTRRLAESSGITIEFCQERGCEQCANGDMTQLYRIAQEAITNAVKHARPAWIAVGLNCVDGKTIILTVRDNGMGRSAAAKTKGGLGLGIMSYRARLIGGGFTITDADGGGTEVVCTVPCAARSEEASPCRIPGMTKGSGFS